MGPPCRLWSFIELLDRILSGTPPRFPGCSCRLPVELPTVMLTDHFTDVLQAPEQPRLDRARRRGQLSCYLQMILRLEVIQPNQLAALGGRQAHHAVDELQLDAARLRIGIRGGHVIVD